MSHLDSVAVDGHKDNGDDEDGGHGHSHYHHHQERGLGHRVSGDNILQEAKTSHPAALALSVGGIGEHEVTESS